MPSFRDFLLICSAILALAAAAVAEPAPPIAAPGIQIIDYGVYCRPGSSGREDAPETTLGYINVMEDEPVFRHRQQQVPGALGISFGLIVISDQTIAQARMETYRPDKTAPDIWYADLTAGERKTRGFSFDFQDEVIPGQWRLEGWDGDTQLYSIAFEVMAPSTLPGVSSDCNLMS